MAHRLTITLPDDVYEKIKEQAERDMRTIGAEIAYQLKLHVPAYKEEQPTTIIQHHLSYPPGVRSPENPAGRPDIITARAKSTHRVKSIHRTIHRVLQRPQHAVHSKT